MLDMAQAALEAFLSTTDVGRLSDQARAAHVAGCYVFGDGAGLKVVSIKRAWETAVLKAHGHAPEWAGTMISPTSRAALRGIDLHFHDLRHEAGSRLLEAGWPLHHVQEMLGHANVSQTSTYLNATRIGLQENMRRSDDFRCNPVANTSQVEQRIDRNDEQRESPKGLVN